MVQLLRNARITTNRDQSEKRFGKVEFPQIRSHESHNNPLEGDNTLIATAVDDNGHVGLSATVRVKVKAAPAPAK